MVHYSVTLINHWEWLTLLARSNHKVRLLWAISFVTLIVFNLASRSNSESCKQGRADAVFVSQVMAWCELFDVFLCVLCNCCIIFKTEVFLIACLADYTRIKPKKDEAPVSEKSRKNTEKNLGKITWSEAKAERGWFQLPSYRHCLSRFILSRTGSHVVDLSV